MKDRGQNQANHSFPHRLETENGGRTRIYSGPMNAVLTGFLVLFALFELWANLTGRLGAVKLRAAHILLLLPLAYLLYPARKKEQRSRALPPWGDMLLALAAAGCFGYLLYRYGQPAFARTGRLSGTDVWVGVGCLVLCFEAARRTSGAMGVIALLFLSYYAVWGRYVPGVFGTAGVTLKRVVSSLVWDTNGILGTGAGVSATYIFVFVLFGSFLKYSGFSQLIHDLSLTLVGRTPGGPAKVAVIASALMGMINGSAIANVATTGTITIPLMKKTGYRKEFAGAVEAAASTGGQFTPPIMGAVGFVMAEFMGVSYTRVMLAAAIPAVLYYGGLMWSVHLEAKRLGLSGLPAENIPRAGEVLRRRGHLLLPLLVLLVMMFRGFTPLFSAIAAMAVVWVVSWVRRDTRMTLSVTLRAIREGAQSAVGVGVSCVIIGVIIGSVNMTGLGVNFGHMILQWAGGGQLFLGGVLVMVLSIILGMGVPGVAAYVIVYAVAVPVLRSLGATEMAANMFCLIYACLSNITPPVAISSYVASGIAGGSMTKTSLTAIRLGIAGFVVPFFFLDHPVLLYGSTEGIPAGFAFYAFLTACAGVAALATGLSGLPEGKYSPGGTALLLLSRGLLIGAGMLFISPSVMTDGIGLGLILLYGALKRGIPAGGRPMPGP